MVVKKAEWWLDPTTADQCGQNCALCSENLVIFLLLSHSNHIDDIDPFQTLHVNYMLNSVGYPVHKMQRVGAAVPKLTTGHSVTLGEDSFSALKKIASGGFATIFTARLEEKVKVLKVRET